VQPSFGFSDGGDDSAAALADAFDCVQDATKVRDTAALADLLQSHGVTCAAHLTFVDDAATFSVKTLLKPAAARGSLVYLRRK
jgi:hypothetical protein